MLLQEGLSAKISQVRAENPDTDPVNALEHVTFEEFGAVLLGLGRNDCNKDLEEELYELPPAIQTFRDLYCAVVNCTQNDRGSVKCTPSRYHDQWSNKSDERLRACLGLLPPLAPAEAELSTDPATAAVRITVWTVIGTAPAA